MTAIAASGAARAAAGVAIDMSNMMVTENQLQDATDAAALAAASALANRQSTTTSAKRWPPISSQGQMANYVSAEQDADRRQRCSSRHRRQQ